MNERRTEDEVPVSYAGNGNRRPVPQFRKLPAYASPMEVARAYADLTAELMLYFQQIDGEIVETRAAALVASGAAHRAESAAKLTLTAVERLERRFSGPEIEDRARASMPAFDELLEGVLEGVSQRVVDAVHDEHEGRGNITSARVKQIIEDYERSKLADGVIRGRKFRRDVTKGVMIGVIVAVITGIGGLIGGVVLGRSNATHDHTVQSH